MDQTAYFKLSYGLFVAGVESEGKLNGCLINTASQATSDPGRLVATMMKTNLTTELIKKKGSVAISVLSMECPISTIGHFGMNSGRDKDKFADVAYAKDANGNPYLLGGLNARFQCKVEQVIDLGSHNLFVLAVEDCFTVSDADPMTYADYRRLKASGFAKKEVEAQAQKAPEQPKAEAPKTESWICTVCHYVYDGDVPFEETDEDYRCPVCGHVKGVFSKA